MEGASGLGQHTENAAVLSAAESPKAIKEAVQQPDAVSLQSSPEFVPRQTTEQPEVPLQSEAISVEQVAPSPVRAAQVHLTPGSFPDRISQALSEVQRNPEAAAGDFEHDLLTAQGYYQSAA